MRKQLTPATRFLRIFCAVLMMSLGVAHKPVTAIAAPLAAFDDAYRLPDGSFAEICVTRSGVENRGHGGSEHTGDAILFCEACLLASSTLVPVPDASSWIRTSFAWLDNGVRRDKSTQVSSAVLTPKARAPPAYL